MPAFLKTPAVRAAGAPAPFEARAAFMLGLRANGIQNLDVLRALEAVPRSAFVEPDYAAFGYRDVALPLPCGQICTPPVTIARMAQGAALRPDMQVLELGTGSGYGAAIFARLVRRVVSVERYRTLVAHAKLRLASFEIENASLQWADALDLPVLGTFDCVIVNAVADPFPASLWRHVVEGGSIIHARRSDDASQACVLVRSWQAEGVRQEAILGPAHLRPLEGGLPVRL